MRKHAYLVMLLMACLLIGFSSTTDARKPDFIREPDRISWPESVIDVDIIGDNRGLLPISGRHYHAICHIEAQRGERYTIRVRNNWHRRIALAISVDGRNIISGERSYNRPNESMYVLQPGQTGHFEGWRSSYQKVQRFYFTSDNDSYAGRMGDWSQLGWIKVAAFREREYLPQPRYLSEDLVRDRVNVVIKDQESFFDLFKEENTLNLDRNVILVKGPLELPDNLEILSPGIIFVEGDITLKGGIKKCETGNLSLVSLGGDIIIGAVNQEIWAHLATLDGTIYPNNNNPVKIYGALAADKIDLAGNANGQRKWAGGGDLVYDSRLNPAQEDRDSSYAINLADFYDNFSIEKMANEFPENIN